MTDTVNQFPARAAEIREKNERLVLGLMFRAGCMSQSEIAAATGLKAPTVFRIFGELERLGLISQVDPPDSVSPDRKGRRPTWYAVVPGAYRLIGLDFRAGYASVVIEDFSASVLYSEDKALPIGADARELYELISRLISQALERPESSGGPVLGIGVGAPGVVDLARGEVIEYSRIPGLAGFPLGVTLSREFGAPVHMGNNATVAAVASYRYGNHRDASGIFAILIRSGVGGAFIRDGRPYESSGRTALEIGHMVMNPDGPICACGDTGCLEAYLAEDVLLRSVSSIATCPDMETLDGLILAGNQHVIEVLTEAARLLQRAVRTIRHMLEPDAFVIISRSQALSDLFAREVSKGLATMRFPGGLPPVVSGARWDPLMAGRAACDMVFDAFFS
jgi:predicted NBD/HSP70 family sugar kinase